MLIKNTNLSCDDWTPSYPAATNKSVLALIVFGHSAPILVNVSISVAEILY
jgi:hypothetical protein